jgi:hypothetical protein
MGVPVATGSIPVKRAVVLLEPVKLVCSVVPTEDCVGKTGGVWEYTDGVRVIDVLTVEICVGVGVGVGTGCWVEIVVRAGTGGVGDGVDSVEEVDGGGRGEIGETFVTDGGAGLVEVARTSAVVLVVVGGAVKLAVVLEAVGGGAGGLFLFPANPDRPPLLSEKPGGVVLGGSRGLRSIRRTWPTCNTILSSSLASS